MPRDHYDPVVTTGLVTVVCVEDDEQCDWLMMFRDDLDAFMGPAMSDREMLGCLLHLGHEEWRKLRMDEPFDWSDHARINWHRITTAERTGSEFNAPPRLYAARLTDRVHWKLALDTVVSRAIEARQADDLAPLLAQWRELGESFCFYTPSEP